MMAELVAERAGALDKETPMMKEIDISYRTMFAELAQRTLDGGLPLGGMGRERDRQRSQLLVF